MNDDSERRVIHLGPLAAAVVDDEMKKVIRDALEQLAEEGFFDTFRFGRLE